MTRTFVFLTKENDMELISKGEAMQLLEEDYYASRSRGDDERAEVCLLHFIDISNLPTAEERKEGEWLNDINYSGWTCTNCGYHDGNAVYKYCPNCGARMKGERYGAYKTH